MHIRVECLTHIYAPGTPAERFALREISLEIEPGERVGILGPTGSGKSTLVQHIAGLLKPTVGQVLLDGVPAHAPTAEARARRRRVGLAFQYPEQQIFETTVFREVAFGPRNLGLNGEEVTRRVRWALETVGLDPEAFGARTPFALSGGEMRRVALASVLALLPRVLILDEPTAGLDPRGREDLLARLDAWQRETGATLVVVSHHLDEVARLVERVVVLQEGRVVADGPARALLGDGNLWRSLGLAPPPEVALLEALQQLGWPIPPECWPREELAREILRQWQKRHSQQGARSTQHAARSR
ncbi:MAG: energy-coupling factor transporter ATPase [Anaerolineae bacterium]|nr:energy-coupling factor transporter ATPase [Anaerolineae bacterium]MDW7991709.1 energy-coupling factor transporter ATPase [Anaerolineae bacterium]